MIYEYPDEDYPIRQGDIFVGVPRVDFSLEQLPIIKSGHSEEARWVELATEQEPISAVVTLRSVTAIVASQDCDAMRAPGITLCEIRRFRDVERRSKDTKSVKKLIGIITQHARINQKWFYLPPSDHLGFVERMGVDFQTTICLPREELNTVRHLRKGSLAEVARQHFRERLAQFYRRYPVDEWYALDSEEFAQYKTEHGDAQPFPWQG